MQKERKTDKRKQRTFQTSWFWQHTIIQPTRSGGTEKFTDLSVDSDRVPDPWSACKSHFSTVLQVQIRNTCRASVVLPVIKLSRCSGKRKLDTGIKFLLWPTVHQPSACTHHRVACTSVHPPRKVKMTIAPRNNILTRKLPLTTSSTDPPKEQNVAQIFKKFSSFYLTCRSIKECTKAPSPSTGTVPIIRQIQLTSCHYG
jgi:hypothetical protein